MTLLTQTAAPAPLVLHAVATGLSPLVTPATYNYAVPTILRGTTATGPTGVPTMTRIWVEPPLFTSPFAVWQAQSSWPIGMNLIYNLSTLIAPPAGSKRVAGTFQDQNGLPIARTGYLIDKTTGAYLTTFTSSAVDGSWTAYVPTTNPVIIIMEPNVGDSRNSIVLDNIVPVFP